MPEPTQPPATRVEPIDLELLNLAAKAMVRAGRADQITLVHEALAAVLPAHEAMVRAKVAEELSATATYDAAREQADYEHGHEDHCEWNINDHVYCSCRIWPAVCAGVSVAAQIARGEA